MVTVCTSCGNQISSALNFYKCRQCVNHFVCEVCETKAHNRESASFHTLDKMSVLNEKLTSAATNNTSTSSKSSSSIFTSEEYLYSLLSSCDHCYCVIAMDKQPIFECQQCPNGFCVCARCMPLMSTHHPSVHTFSQQPLNHWAKIVHDMYHLGIKCDGCSLDGYNGKRYQCEECPPSYDLCENCFGQKHTQHKFRYIQNPLLHGSNQWILGQRSLELAKKYGNNNSDWRDPLTGWTRSDAELVIQQANQETNNYHTRLQEIEKKNAEYAEEERRIARQQLVDSERRLQDSNDDFHRWLMWH